jgi:Fe-Mn family superoxide dismutase
MAYELPKLAYANNALEPHIDAKTMEIHHDKHHQAYITNANNLLKDHAALAALDVNALIADLSKVPEAIRGGVRNNAGGHSNHSFFWTVIGPGKGGAPKGKLAAAIDAELGGFAKFKEDFAKAGATRFGSGWAWLVVTSKGQLEILSLPNQDSPISDGNTPIFGVDVWEHAYYLKYQNRRPEYLAAIWNVVNWNAVGEFYAAAKTKPA